MENYRIIDAAQEQLEQIEMLERQCFSVPWTLEMLRSQLPDERHEFLAAERDGEIIGYVGMMYILDEGYISNVAVAPSERRRGVADALITELLHRAAQLSLGFVTLEVRASNTPAVELYSKHGFVPVGRRKNYYDLPKEDAILMTRFL